MITDKQRQRDYEYDGDYQSKSRYTEEQWNNILSSGQLSDEDISLLKQIYGSFNHAATLVQLAFHNKTTEEALLAQVNAMGELLAKANDIKPEVDFEGNEYWWFLYFWGKNTDAGTLELKLHPELTEAIGALWPEAEEKYYAFMNDVERSLQIRYNQEDAVWVAAAVLLYEKYYQNPGISADEILLMQYEVQTRAQKVFGQDINVNTITQICNADERGHRFNYLRDIYKYYRVAFPGEFEGDRERPDPENFDYNAYIYSIYGYMTLQELLDFIKHEYAHLVDESYVELNASNGFVRLADFLTRQGGAPYNPEDTSEQALSLRADGEDCVTTFHMLADALIKEYPNFTYARKTDWFQPSEGRISYIFCDVLSMENYAHTHAGISFLTVPDGDAVNIEIALNLPFCSSEEAMLDIQDKCNMLTLMTSAPFKVENVATEGFDLTDDSQKIKASVLYSYEEFKTMKEEDIVGMMSTATEIFASYYTDICQNYYPAADEMPEEDPFAAALGSKLKYRPAREVPGPQIIYKQGGISPTTEYVTKVLQGYDVPSGQEDEAPENTENSFDGSAAAAYEAYDDDETFAGAPAGTGTGSAGDFGREEATQSGAARAAGSVILPDWYNEEKVPVSTHPDRSEQGFHLYPKNTLIRGPLKTAKYHEAMLTAVGIIEGKDSNMMRIEPVPDILEHYKNYVEEKRIMHISYPDIDGQGYDNWIESKNGPAIRDGIFKEFANRCADGRYVVMMEEVDVNWMHLFGETAVLLRDNRREGTGSETAVTLKYSKETFRLPSNLYIVATCDSNVSEDTVLGAISHDFFIRHIAPDSSVLRGIRVEGILLERLMATINLRLSYFLGADFQLGEGFFLGEADKDPFISLARIFREQLIPLLEKWFDGDIERIRYVLGDNGKQRPDTIFYRETPFRDNLFKGEIPDSFDTGRCIYEINEDAFFNPKSYIDIYE
ncbi:MAG TPA: hypothetical protein H9968_01835 [Candidatus Anaerobutyricum stercoris]|uniref:Uncharacterized protein n=1 Tax=Candidatus Anaerobutyricum stercoris TaxID=2838457 RepID=A0A9D2EJ49_9FIRM|nr:hypothetical protein [Candidatus Anaerobutyricum stercoris]